MTIVKHELRQGRLSFGIWTAAIGGFLAVCVFVFPEMGENMASMGEAFASMGSFTAAFGMDRLNIGTLTGFYALECGTIVGLGGAFFAALLGTAALSKEERDHTAEFLFSHPVSRTRVITEKLAAVLLQLAAMNLLLFGAAAASITMIGEAVPWPELRLLHTAYFLMQLEVAGVCFGLSAFLRRGGTGVGLGLATALYFMNLLANLSDQRSFLKRITPVADCEGAGLLADGQLDASLVLPGLLCAALCVGVAYRYYGQKDLH